MNRIWLPAFALVVATQIAIAQQSMQSDAQHQQDSATSGDLNRPGAAANAAQLTATSTAKLVTVSLANQQALRPINWSFSLSSPIIQGSDSDGGQSATNTKIATLDGLANGFKAQFKLYAFRFVGGYAPSDPKILQTAITNCYRETPKDQCDKLAKDTSHFIESYGGDGKTAASKLQALTDYLTPQFQGESGIRAWTGGIAAAVGYNSFTFYQANTLAKQSQNSTPWSAGAFVGVVPNFIPVDKPTMLTLAANYQDAFIAQQTSTMCLNRANDISCQSGSFGKPKNTRKMLISLDLNTKFNILGHWVGMGPQVTYDAMGGGAGVDFPFLFLSDSSGGLTGGLDVGWISKTHDFSIGFVVGVPFSVFSGSN